MFITIIGLIFALALAFFGFVSIRKGVDELGIIQMLLGALVLGLTLGRLLPF